MENVSLDDGRRPARHHRLLAGPRRRRRARARPPARAGVRRRRTARRPAAPGRVRGRAWSIVVYLHVVLGEMVPKNIALAGPDRAALVLGPPMMVHRHRAAPGRSPCMNAVANGVAAAASASSPRTRSPRAFTREEVAALVEESRGEGLIEEDEYDRLAGALGFTEKRWPRRHVPPDTLATVPAAPPPPTSRRSAPPPASAASRSPATTATLLGYLHIKDVLESDDDKPRARHRGQVDPSLRHGRPPATCCTTRWRRLQAKGAHMARVVDARRQRRRAGHARGRARGARRRDPRRCAPDDVSGVEAHGEALDRV